MQAELKRAYELLLAQVSYPISVICIPELDEKLVILLEEILCLNLGYELGVEAILNYLSLAKLLLLFGNPLEKVQDREAICL